MPKYKHKIIAGLIYAPLHVTTGIAAAIRSLRNRSLTRSHRTTRFLSESFVYNLSAHRESICIGQRTVIRGELFVFAHGGRIEVGDWCYIGVGSRIWSSAGIRIGNRTLISHNVEIHDTNAHAISAYERHMQFDEMLSSGHQTNLPNVGHAPIVIGDDVWIGFRSVILKGVNIGNGAIVAAGSLVLGDVPSWSMVAGNPARVIRKLEQEY